MSPEKDYRHRTTVQKLGVRADERVEVAGDVGRGLRDDVKKAIGRGLVRSGELDGRHGALAWQSSFSVAPQKLAPRLYLSTS